ncbi:aminoglycoside phosphotransferase family protein [Pseudonocardia phyllosphaerae]|uniref:aminoglycoside phosphotransferase family protein n=1 Tax=Pseudonocardia phyllosphaerae TaxID=3390502 RepID=UPI00397CDD5F
MAEPPVLPDDDWLGPLAAKLRRPVRVASRAALTGGVVAGSVERITLDDGTDVVLKTGDREKNAAEAAALRAVAVVNGPVRVPRMLAHGDDWLVLAHEPGEPLGPGDPVPDEVWRSLALVHAHWRRNRPRGVPVVDPRWWEGLCAQAADALDRAGADSVHDGADSGAADRIGALATDPRIGTALAALPRTLCHGDAHRGNVLRTPGGGILLDWGNARVAPGSLDTAVLAAPPVDGPADAPAAPVPEIYRETLHAATGAADPPRMIAAETAWARVQAHVQYLPYSAEHLGADRAASMVRVVDEALAELGAALGM